METQFKGKTDFNESIYNRLNDCFDSDDQKIIVDNVIRSFTFADIEKIIEIFIADKITNDCMPDNIKSKEEHDQYLKDIGHVEYLEKLQEFKDSHVGLWATDKPSEILDPKGIMYQITF